MVLAVSLHRVLARRSPAASVPRRGSPFARQLWLGCDRARARARGMTDIVLLCAVDTSVPEAGAPLLLQAAEALVAQAIQFGMTMHLIGRVAVRVVRRGSHLMLEVEDDGLAHGRQPSEHVGLAAIRRFAEQAGGRLELEHCWAFHTVRLFLPDPINAAGAKVAQSAGSALF